MSNMRQSLKEELAQICEGILKSRGLKVTPQRLEVLMLYFQSGLHPAANEVWLQLKKKFPSVSRATAYNILDAFIRKGIIISLNTPEGIRFDFNTTPHAHFICRVCGRIDDIDIDIKSLLRANVGDRKPDDVRVYFYGLCKKCREDSKI